MAIVFPVMMATVMYGVDFGRIECAKLELEGCADAAARYAASTMVVTSNKSATALSQAQAVGNQSHCEGNAITITSSNVQTGIWNSNTKIFTPSTGSSADSVKIVLTYDVGASGAPLFGKIIGVNSIRVSATSIAQATIVSADVTVPASGNLWLSGMPYNTTITNLQSDSSRYDNSGNSSNQRQRPIALDLSSANISPGDLITFAGVTGTGNNGGYYQTTADADGQSRLVALGDGLGNSAPNNSVNGIANVRAPLGAFMGIFMDASTPNLTSAPANLDFATTSSLNYRTLSPAKKQPFFIGDGQTDSGITQYITVPTNATRIFLGTMDAWQWNDNSGTFDITVYKGVSVETVK